MQRAGAETAPKERPLTAGERRRLPEATDRTRFLEPSTEQEILETLTMAHRERLAVVPWGAGTRQRYGEPLVRADLVLGLGNLSGILEDGSRDGFVTVAAGTPVRELANALRDRGQAIGPVPVAGPGSTVGGLIATGTAGPHRLWHGGIRDAVLGLVVALPDGRRIRTGGRVVKNVAGYDLTRLLTGSLGTLGVILAAHLRVWPWPPVRRTVGVTVDPAGATGPADHDGWTTLVRLGDAVLDRGLEPAAIEVVAGRLGAEGPAQSAAPCLWVDYLLGERAAEQAVRETRDLAADAGCRVVFEASAGEADALWERLETDLPGKSSGQVRLSLPRSEVLETCGDVLATLAGTEPVDPHITVTASPGTGIVRVWVGSDGTDAWGDEIGAEAAREAWVSAIQRLREATERRRGALTLEAAPLWLRARIGSWGEAIPAAAKGLSEGLKAALDPGEILNPGRMVRGARIASNSAYREEGAP